MKKERTVDKAKKVICHRVVFADIINAGDIYVPDESQVVVDDDLVVYIIVIIRFVFIIVVMNMIVFRK